MNRSEMLELLMDSLKQSETSFYICGYGARHTIYEQSSRRMVHRENRQGGDVDLCLSQGRIQTDYSGCG